jgi:hypothetical protein
MQIGNLPNEILFRILEEAVKLHQKDGIVFTYGLSKLPECRDKSVPTTVQKYLRGPTPLYQQRWDASRAIRLVSKQWHDWALGYAVRDVYVKIWRGSERWFDLTSLRGKWRYFFVPT